MSETLPRPRLTLRVGITGHRTNKLDPGKLPRLREALEGTLAAIEAAAHRAAKRLADLPYEGGPPELRIVSALADGADRMAAEAAAGWSLCVVTPLPLAEYERDFLEPGETTSESLLAFRALLGRASSVTELPLLADGPAGAQYPRSRHYAALSAFLVQQVDLLIGVWDGNAAEGPGGTATVVTQAQARGLDVVWIDSERPDEVRLLSGLAHLDIRQPVSVPLDDAELDARLDAILGLNLSTDASSPHPHDGHAAEPAPAARPAYLREPWPRRLRWTLAYPLLRWLSGAGRWTWPITHPPRAEALRAWDPFFRIAEGQDGHAPSGSTGRLDDLRRILLPRSAWSDALASYHGHLYRSAYVTVFVLAGLSVPVGLIYLFLQSSPAILDIKAAFVLAELVIISAVVMLVRRGTGRHWHHAWIETRELSELLRLSRPLACLGALADMPGPGGGGRDTFATWYARATMRELRPVPGVLDAGYIRRILRATLETEIRDQRRWHAANARDLARIDHFLHRWGNRCFGATTAVLLAYLALWLADAAVPASHAAAGGAASSGLHAVLHDVVKPLVSVLAAGFPAFGAALAGIRAQGDFGARARNSAATRDQLAEIEREIQAILVSPRPDEPSLRRAGDVLLTAMRVMTDDVQAWRQTYVSKALTLPA